MAAMTIALVIAVVWLASLLALAAVCRAAALGDRAMRTRLGDRWADTHERPLAA
jgi:hypothetical protein